MLWERVPNALRIVVSKQDDNEFAQAQLTVTGIDTVVSAHANLARPWEPGLVLATIRDLEEKLALG